MCVFCCYVINVSSAVSQVHRQWCLYLVHVTFSVCSLTTVVAILFLAFELKSHLLLKVWWLRVTGRWVGGKKMKIIRRNSVRLCYRRDVTVEGNEPSGSLPTSCTSCYRTMLQKKWSKECVHEARLAGTMLEWYKIM